MVHGAKAQNDLITFTGSGSEISRSRDAEIGHKSPFR